MNLRDLWDTHRLNMLWCNNCTTFGTENHIQIILANHEVYTQYQCFYALCYSSHLKALFIFKEETTLAKGYIFSFPTPPYLLCYPMCYLSKYSVLASIWSLYLPWNIGSMTTIYPKQREKRGKTKKRNNSLMLVGKLKARVTFAWAITLKLALALKQKVIYLNVSVYSNK